MASSKSNADPSIISSLWTVPVRREDRPRGAPRYVVVPRVERPSSLSPELEAAIELLIKGLARDNA